MSGNILTNTLSQNLTTAGNPRFASQTIGDANFGFDLGVTFASQPSIRFAADTTISLDRASQQLALYVGGNLPLLLTSGGANIIGIASVTGFPGGSPPQLQLKNGIFGYTITGNPIVDRTYTLPDAGVNADFILSQGAQTINGAKTFGSSVNIQPGATIAELKLTTTGGNGLLSRSQHEQ